MTTSIKDQLNRTVEIKFPPKRIISLVPSITELLFDLGLEESIVGVTKFCVRPEKARKTKQIVGGTKNLRLETISNLKPDLIIANKEENEKLQVEALEKKFPVWISDVKSFDEAIQMIMQVGEITNKTENAIVIVDDILTDRMKYGNLGHKHYKSVYLIWRDPWMTIGGDTFISEMMEMGGFINLFRHQKRYPVITDSELSDLKPELILLSSEPYPFKEKHVAELKALCPSSKVMLVDGEMFSWYGSRMKEAIRYVGELAIQ